jgi:hypothetical protein
MVMQRPPAAFSQIVEETAAPAEEHDGRPGPGFDRILIPLVKQELAHRSLVSA